MTRIEQCQCQSRGNLDRLFVLQSVKLLDAGLRVFPGIKSLNPGLATSPAFLVLPLSFFFVEVPGIGQHDLAQRLTRLVGIDGTRVSLFRQ